MVDVVDYQEQARNEINKKYKNVLVSADSIVKQERRLVHVSPCVDYALNGGIPEGSWVIFSGAPKSGKSVSALQTIANAQQQYNKPAYIINTEHRLNKKELEGVHGLRIQDLEIIQSNKGKILSAQEFLQETTTILKTVPECIIVIDSTSALCAEKEFVEDITSQARNEGPKLLATFCRKMGSVVPVQNSIVIVIQHLIANTSGYGSPYYEDGGRKIQYQADIKIRATGFQKWKLSATSEDQVGQIINWQVETSALGKPGAKFQSYLRYGYGLDDIKEYITIAMDMGIISKGGAWYTFGEERFHGEENMRTAFLENREMLNQLKDNVSSLLS